MKKTALLSAVSAVALAVSLNAAPALAFDKVDWDWNHNTYSDMDAFFDIDVDFVGWGLTQVERLQVMAGNMSAFADGSYASYNDVNGGYSTASAPIYIYQKAEADLDQYQLGLQANVAAQGGIATGGAAAGLTGAAGGGALEQEQEGVQANIAAQLGAAIAGNVVIINMDDMDSYWSDAVDARYHLASVEIGATAISNIASVDGEHVTMAHDGQIAFGKFNSIDGVYYDDGYTDDEEQASLANLALANWIGSDYYGQFEGSGNRNYDMLMLGWTAAQYGLIGKGYNSAYAFGDYITDAQVDVSATAAANIHTASVGTLLAAGEADYGNGYGYGDPVIETDNVAMVDVNQFGYMDNYAHASAVGHSISGYSYLGKLDAPALKVSASALGNVSTVTNKFAGTAE